MAVPSAARGDVVKWFNTGVCKTPIHRFESGRRLHTCARMRPFGASFLFGAYVRGYVRLHAPTAGGYLIERVRTDQSRRERLPAGLVDALGLRGERQGVRVGSAAPAPVPRPRLVSAGPAVLDPLVTKTFRNRPYRRAVRAPPSGLALPASRKSR